MTDALNDGGNAFPMATAGDIYPGMTLRDWFAGQALVGMLTTSAAPILTNAGRIEKEVAVTAYALADALLKEREGNL